MTIKNRPTLSTSIPLFRRHQHTRLSLFRAMPVFPSYTDNGSEYTGINAPDRVKMLIAGAENACIIPPVSLVSISTAGAEYSPLVCKGRSVQRGGVQSETVTLRALPWPHMHACMAASSAAAVYVDRIAQTHVFSGEERLPLLLPCYAAVEEPIRVQWRWTWKISFDVHNRRTWYHLLPFH